MKLSIVTTLYQSESYIDEFYKRSSLAARELSGEDYEIIIVNDGSPDSSLDIAIRLSESDPHVVVINLSRNFGHHKAMMTGLAQSKGELVFLIDSDLEEKPEWLAPFFALLKNEDCDVVYGVQSKRRGKLIEKWSGWVFYRIFRMLTGISQPDNIVTARLMRRYYVEALIKHQERELNIGGIWLITGFRQSKMHVAKQKSSPTSYSFRKKVSHLINAITSFSSLPLVFTFYTGTIISLSALFFIAYLVFRYLFIATPPSGYTSIVTSVWLFSGLIIFFLGLQGIYLSKIFIEVKQRPYTIIKSVHHNNQLEMDK